MKKMFTRLFLAGAVLAGVSAQAQVLFQEDFEATSGGAIPATWSQTTLATDGGWKSGTGSGMSSQYFAIPDHSKILATNDDGCNCDKSNDVLVTPSMDFTGVAHPFVAFDLFYREDAYDDGTTVFYESLLLKVSTDNGANWTLLDTMHYTANAAGTQYAWKTLTYSLESYANQPNVKLAWVYNDDGGWVYGAGLDNVQVYSPSPVDAALTAVVPVPGDLSAYGLPGTTITFGGTILNQGYQPITSATVSYTVDGGTPVSQTLTGLNIAPFTSYDFTISPAYALVLGNHNVDITLNVSGDASTTNDQMSTNVGGAQFMPNHTVTFEEGTGTWCGWCPRGAVYMDSMHTVYGSGVVLVAAHNNDPMKLTVYDNGVSAMIGGYPSVLIDRKEEVDPSDMFLGYQAHENDFGFANLSATKTYNASSRQLSVDASANIAVDLTGDYRLALVLTEEMVHGTATTYDQTNYYSGAPNSGTTALPFGAGHEWHSEPDPVPAAMMYYNHVARYISGGFTGQAGSLPASVLAGQTYNYTFTTTLPSTWRDWYMNAVVLLIDATNNRILNAVNVPGLVNSNDDMASQVSRLMLFPNPAEGTLNMSLTLETKTNVNVDIVDVLGKVVASYNYNNVDAGTNQVSYDISNMANGVYFANVKTDAGVVSRKFVKQ
jgi:hypothetical protein